jgi:hypothetical protein
MIESVEGLPGVVVIPIKEHPKRKNKKHYFLTAACVLDVVQYL